jgi:hypothetical protein
MQQAQITGQTPGENGWIKADAPKMPPPPPPILMPIPKKPPFQESKIVAMKKLNFFFASHCYEW